MDKFDVYDRIKDSRQRCGLSQAELAQKVGFKNRSTIAKIEAKERDITRTQLVKFAEALETSPEYLLTGQHPSRATQSPTRIRVYGDVAAGVPIDEIDNMDFDDPDNWEEIPPSMAKSGTYFGLRIKGDSMSPRICNGDVVIVRQQSTIENGDIAIVAINGEKATCKKVKKTEQGITLVGLNPAFTPMFFSWQEVAETPVSILGKVVENRAKF